MITPAELTAIPLFADLNGEQLEFTARSVEDIRLLPGEYAGHEGDERALFVVVEGHIQLTKDVNGVERVVGKRHPGELFGEVPMMLSTNLPASCGAITAARVLKFDVPGFFALAAMAPDVATAVGASALMRQEQLKELATEPATPEMLVIGQLHDVDVHRIQTFLDRNRIRFESIGQDAPTFAALAANDRLPVVVMADGRRLVAPSVREVAMAGAIPVVPARDDYDVVIIGGGPAGLTAAVNGAAEGLRTLVVERFAPGGQAGTSTRIENYTGFPFGVSGDELASKALRQAKRLGAEVIVTRTVEAIDPGSRSVTLDGGDQLGSRVVILSSGVEWRHLPVPEIDRFVGKGVYYGAARSDSGRAQGNDVYIIGAGNSAGQAAIFFSRRAKTVTLIVRGDSLRSSMSQYLIDQIGANQNIRVEARSEVVAVHGVDDLRSIEVADRDAGTSSIRETEALFVMIGADADTGWLPSEIVRDEHGYIVTGSGARDSGVWAADRDPFALETTAPGVFAAGDVRSGSVKRVAAGVGEGGMVIAFVHQYLALS